MRDKRRKQGAAEADGVLRDYVDDLLDAAPAASPHGRPTTGSAINGLFAAERTRIRLFVLHGLNLGVAEYDIAALAQWRQAQPDPQGGASSRCSRHLGSYMLAGRPIPIVNISPLLLPDEWLRRSPRQRAGFSHVLVLKAGLALACHDIAEAVDVARTEVCWRTTQTRRPWLAGTVERLSCALLEVRGLMDAI